mgnify:CR=1 FL=1
MSKQIVLVNFNEEAYLKVEEIVTKDNIQSNSISGDLDIIFKDAFKQSENTFDEQKDKYILFNEFDNEEITSLYKEITKFITDSFILVKLMDNNSQLQLQELLTEVSKEDELMRRYYHLETLFKAINIIDPVLFDEADKLKIMSAYSVYKNDTYELEEINESIKMMEELIKDKENNQK